MTPPVGRLVRLFPSAAPVSLVDMFMSLKERKKRNGGRRVRLRLLGIFSYVRFVGRWGLACNRAEDFGPRRRRRDRACQQTFFGPNATL